MLFHPAVMALLLGDAVSLALLIPSGWFAVRLLRHWDLSRGDARQIRLERRTYLVATVLGFVFIVQILSLLLFVFTADRLAIQFVGAMCAVGTLNVNPFGFPALYAKLVLFFLAAVWLFMDYVDNRAPDYPLIRKKYALVLLIVPVAIAAAWIQWRYFYGLRAEVITSCCGSLFGGEGGNLAAEVAAWSPLPAMFLFYSVLGGAVVAGLWYVWRRSNAWIFSILTAISFPVAIAAVVTFLSLYVYEHPHHHCPFCLLKAEYGYVGYAFYLPLFGASALGAGLGVTLPLTQKASVRAVLESVTPGVVTVATAFLFWCIAFSGWISWHSNLKLLE